MIDGAKQAHSLFWRITLPLGRARALVGHAVSPLRNAWKRVFCFAFCFYYQRKLEDAPRGPATPRFSATSIPGDNSWRLRSSWRFRFMLVYIYAQRYLVEGLTLGSVKG